MLPNCLHNPRICRNGGPFCGEVEVGMLVSWALYGVPVEGDGYFMIRILPRWIDSRTAPTRTTPVSTI